MSTTDYEGALRYLYGFADYERHTPRQQEFQNLDNIYALLEAVGSPHERLRAVHVAGTKGKGSTAAMLDAILRAAGNRVGMYSSPHLNTHRERYRLGGLPVSEGLFTDTLRELRPAVERVRARRPLTTFEVSVALAFTLFVKEGVDWAVVEVGLGGRLDTTNVLTPALSVITSISLDHTQVLGDTVESIAAEKAGIIKPGVPVVVAPQRPEALAVIRSRASETGSRLLVTDELVSAVDRQGVSPYRQELTLRTGLTLAGEPLDGCRLGLNLLGAHQVENALTATVAATALDPTLAGVRPRRLVEALEKVSWPGRFEVVRAEPPIVLDGAHNPDSVRKLRVAVGEVFPGRRAVYVFGAGRGHDADGMLAEVAGERLVLTRSTHPRSRPADELAALADARGIPYRTAATVPEALALATEGAEVVVVCGTLFVVADAREALGLAEATDPVRS